MFLRCIFPLEFFLIGSLACAWGVLTFAEHSYAQKIQAHPDGLYHGAYVDFGDFGDEVSTRAILDYRILTQQPLTWAYFSNPWRGGKVMFPQAQVQACQRAGVIPYIRMMPWSRLRENAGADPIFSMQAIIDGRFDPALRSWAQAAKNFRQPLIIEFGPEANGDWFPWNGRWNGSGYRHGYGDPQWPDGPERFRDAFRHIVDLFRRESVANVTWVFHVDAATTPDVWWNDVRYYYPGDDYIDWIGISVFGAQRPDHTWRSFADKLGRNFQKIAALSAIRPLFIAEFAVVEMPSETQAKAVWLQQALQSLANHSFAGIFALSYWNSFGYLSNGAGDMRVQSSPAALQQFRGGLAKLNLATDVYLTNSQRQTLLQPSRRMLYLPRKLMSRDGLHVEDGLLSKLHQEQQWGEQEDWQTFWDLQPTRRQFTLEFELTAPRKNVTMGLHFVVARVRGYQKSVQEVSFWLWDLQARRWLFVGDNQQAKDWVWSELAFAQEDLERFVAGDTIRLQIKSNNAVENLFLDYLAVESYLFE